MRETVADDLPQRWGFPPKHTITKEDEQLTERIRQLWERNTSQKEMLEILRGEGFEISDRGMMRIRSKNGWLLRIPNGLISYAKSRSKRKRDQAHEAQEEQEDTQDTSLGQEERNVIAALRDRGAVGALPRGPVTRADNCRAPKRLRWTTARLRSPTR